MKMNQFSIVCFDCYVMQRKRERLLHQWELNLRLVKHRSSILFTQHHAGGLLNLCSRGLLPSQNMFFSIA